MSTVRTYQYPWEGVPLTKRISRKLRKLMKLNTHFRIGISTMEVPEDMAWTFFEDGNYYEKNVCYWLEKILLATKSKVFYDVGANYGYYCLKLAGNASHIYAFEPVTRTHDMLVKNIRKNNLTNITVYELGLSDKSSRMAINLFSSSGKNSLFIQHSEFDRFVGQEVISLVALDDLIEDCRLSPPSLIKIDIEGGELYALRGARKTIKKYQPVLLIEYLEATFKDAGYSKSDVVAELEAADYVIYGIPADITDVHVYPMAKSSDIEFANIIALPKSMENNFKDTNH